MPKLSIIISITGFDYLREIALNDCLTCLSNQSFREFELIIVEQLAEKESLIDNKQCKRHEFSNNITHVVLPYQEKGFNKAWCMNVGIRKTTTDVIMFLDSDMKFDNEYVNNAYNYFTGHKHKFMVGWDKLIKEPGRDEPKERIVGGQIQTAGGIFWVTKEFYLDVGCMSENFFGYGGEDNCFWRRANSKLGGTNKHFVVNYFNYTIKHSYHHNAIPSKNRLDLLNRSVEQPEEVIRRLKKYYLGDEKAPLEINILNIQLRKNPTYKE